MINAFHRKAGKYFNYGYLGRNDKIISLLNHNLCFSKNSSQVKKLWETYQLNFQPTGKFEIEIPVYNGSNPGVNEICSFLTHHLSDSLLMAVVHGSIASDEVINYSDFDGLVVVKNEVFNDNSSITHVAKLLNEAYALLLKFDPLQHHGWIVLSEKDMVCWPDNIFPHVLFNHSKSLLNYSTKIAANFYYSIDASNNHLRFTAEKLINFLNQRGFPNDMFTLKSILSEFMLLPALYFQTKQGKCIGKKESFTLLYREFDISEIQVMDEVSEIRALWPDCKLNFKDWHPAFVNLSTRKKQINGMTVSFDIRKILTEELKIKMVNFANHLTNRLP